MQFFQLCGKLVVFLGLVGFAAGIIKVGLNYLWPNLSQSSTQTVYDTAGIFTKDQFTLIHQYHKELLNDHDIDYRILSISSDLASDVSLISYQKFKDYDVGALSQSGRGLLLVIDMGQNKVRLEVSASLEGVFTDSFVSYLQHRQMIPFFRTGKISEGILATSEMIFARAQQAEAGHDFSPPLDNKSTGGGAANPAMIGKGQDLKFRQGPDVTLSQADVFQVLKAYQGAMKNRNGNPNLSIYSEKTQKMLKSWTVTPGQMDNESKNLAKCGMGTTKVSSTHAVIRFSIKDRNCPPYFFVLEKNMWRLDLTMMKKAVRFNHRNQWHFDLNYVPKQGPYGFAFLDWRFDQYGFPHS